MVFEHIEQLKRQYTDKYVVVDEGRPELARFHGYTGVVKTVNMSGRALVEFSEYLANIGWYDIELDFLQVVPKPEPGAVAAHAAKPAAAKAAAEKTVVAKAVPGNTAPAKTVPTKEAAKPATAKPAPAKAAGKPSTADVLAALRAKKGAPVAPAGPGSAGEEQTTPEPPLQVEGNITEAPEGAEVAGDEPAIAAPVKAAPAKAAGAKPSAGKVPGAGKASTVAEKVAYCRLVDTKS